MREYTCEKNVQKLLGYTIFLFFGTDSVFTQSGVFASVDFLMNEGSDYHIYRSRKFGASFSGAKRTRIFNE